MEILYILLVLLLVTRFMGEVAVRVGQPPLVGELIGGIVLGIIGGTFSEHLPVLKDVQHDEVFIAITDLGIFFLMLLAGLEMRPRELADVSGKASIVAVAGMLVPLAGGMALGWAFIPDSDYKVAQVLFIGTSLAITAVPVAVRVLMDIGQLESRMGRVIVSAAIFDDILSLVLLAVLTGVIETGAFPDMATFLMLLGKIVLFFAATGAIGHWLLPALSSRLHKMQADEFEFSGVLITGLLYAVAAEMLGLHFIIGAFMAGLFFERRMVGKKTYDNVRAQISGTTTGFLAPVFFASIGLQLSFDAVTATPVFLVIFIVVAVLVKVIGTGIPAYWLGLSKAESASVGFGMCARGAVELIIADIALKAGLFSKPSPTPNIVEALFSTVVLMAIFTTLLAPIALRLIMAKAKPKEDG